MVKPTKRINIAVLRRYETYDFQIAPSLAGCVHRFNFENRKIEFHLPKKPKFRDSPEENSPIQWDSYHIYKGRKIPRSYHVNMVEAVIDTVRTSKVPSNALGKVNVSLFSKSEREKFDEIAHQATQVLNRAFDYWIGILRWKTKNSMICQPIEKRHLSLWATYLIDAGNKSRFYSPGLVFKVKGVNPVKKHEWTAVQKALENAVEVPLWYRYYVEANHRLAIDDRRGFILSLAIASETLIRALMEGFLKTPINKAYMVLINSISIGRILDRWRKIGFNSRRWQRQTDNLKEVKKVIELRNAIMHRGQSQSIMKKECETLMAAVFSFIEEGEFQLNKSNKTKQVIKQ